MSNTIPRMVVDTILWVRFMLGDNSLSPAMRDLIDRAAQKGKLFLSSLACAEVAMLVKAGKLVLHQSEEKWLEQAIASSSVQVLDVGRDIALEMEQLPKSSGQLSYAEKALIATARVNGITLLTERRSLLSYAETGFVKIKRVA